MPLTPSHLKNRHLKKTPRAPKTAAQTWQEGKLRGAEGGRWLTGEAPPSAPAGSKPTNPRRAHEQGGHICSSPERMVSGNAYVLARYQHNAVRVMAFHYKEFFFCFTFCPPMSTSNQHSGGIFRGPTTKHWLWPACCSQSCPTKSVLPAGLITRSSSLPL